MELLPKVLKKIGLGIISLGLISTFYIPEAKAGNLTLYEFTVPSSVPTTGGRKYAIKMVTSSSNFYNNGKLLLKRVGSGNPSCKMWVRNVVEKKAFMICVTKELANVLQYDLINAAISKELGL